MVQHVTAAVSIVGSLLLCLVFIGLVYDLITGYSARRRFAKLLSLKKVWQGGKSCATAAPPIGRRAYRPPMSLEGQQHALPCRSIVVRSTPISRPPTGRKCGATRTQPDSCTAARRVYGLQPLQGGKMSGLGGVRCGIQQEVDTSAARFFVACHFGQLN
jgi:hypothetical protein